MKEYQRKRRRSFRSFKSHLKPIRSAFGELRAIALTTKHVEDYQTRRLEDEGKAPGTLNREIQILTRAFKLGRQRGVIIAEPYIPSVPDGRVRQGFFEKSEFEAVVAALPEHLQDFTRFAYLCAWRKGQVAKLKWTDVDRNAGVIIAPGEIVKNKQPHKIVLAGELAEIIERRWQARDYSGEEFQFRSEYVFHRNGQRIRDPRKAWASACRAAGLLKPKLDKDGKPVTTMVDGNEEPVMVPSKLFHDLRRSGVRNMVRAGGRESVAMKISGHKTRAIFERYNITSDDDLREAVELTETYLKTQPAVPNVVAFGKRS